MTTNIPAYHKTHPVGSRWKVREHPDVLIEQRGRIGTVSHYVADLIFLNLEDLPVDIDRLPRPLGFDRTQIEEA